MALKKSFEKSWAQRTLVDSVCVYTWFYITQVFYLRSISWIFCMAMHMSWILILKFISRLMTDTVWGWVVEITGLCCMYWILQFPWLSESESLLSPVVLDEWGLSGGGGFCIYFIIWACCLMTLSCSNVFLGFFSCCCCIFWNYNQNKNK